jgi:mRNA interferase RelE/StbE
MRFSIEFSPHAARDLKSLSREVAKRVMKKINTLHQGLVGDIKQLSNFRPAYRLRVGDYRVLFDIEGDTIIVYRIRHRREAYRR